MKKIFVTMVVFLSLASVSNSFAFLDYLFSGSASRDAIDNSAVGDLRHGGQATLSTHSIPIIPAVRLDPPKASRAVRLLKWPSLSLNSPLLITTRPEVKAHPPSTGNNSNMLPSRRHNSKCNMDMVAASRRNNRCTNNPLLLLCPNTRRGLKPINTGERNRLRQGWI